MNILLHPLNTLSELNIYHLFTVTGSKYIKDYTYLLKVQV